jgi:predicted tellurium resistance membrane protein TerC
MRLIDKFPILVLAGGGLLGYIAGEMAIEDPAVVPWIAANASHISEFAPLTGFALVVAVGVWLTRRRARARES